MVGFVEGVDRGQSTLFPARLDEYVTEDNPVRAVDVFVDGLNLDKLGFIGVQPLDTGRPSYHPRMMLKLYIYGYLNRVPSSRRLERECQRNIEMIWLTGQLAPDFKTIADFRKDNGKAKDESNISSNLYFVSFFGRPALLAHIFVRRHHLFVSRPEQLMRMKKLGLILSVQDHLYLAAPALKNYLGLARASQITPLKTYLDAGFLVVGGTDSPVVPFNPFFAYYHFLTRETISDGVYGANERVTSREHLLRMITINYAGATGEADIKGSIEPGKLADFAVLSEDLLTVAEAKIPTVRAMLTYVGGREVFRDAAMK
jgi:transposase